MFMPDILGKPTESNHNKWETKSFSTDNKW